jgi:hypothetical protein
VSDLGSDIAALEDGDLDPMFGEMSGPALVAADLRAELLTAEGSLFYDPAHGFDVRAGLGARVTDARRAQMATRIEAVCLRDDRVASVDVRVTGSLVIEVDGLTSTNEPFRFVLDVADVAARLSETPT